MGIWTDSRQYSSKNSTNIYGDFPTALSALTMAEYDVYSIYSTGHMVSIYGNHFDAVFLYSFFELMLNQGFA